MIRLPLMRRILPWFLAALFLSTAGLTGCKKSAPDVPQELQLYPWQGDLIELLPHNYASWIYVDIASLRDQPRIGELLDSFIRYAPDAFTIALMRGDEALFGISETDDAPALSIVRSEYISSELRASIQQGSLHGGEAPSEPDRLVGHRVTRNEAGTQWIAAPTPNLLISGPEDALKRTLTSLQKVQATPGKQAGATVVFSLPFQSEAIPVLQTLMEQPAVREQTEAIQRVTGSLRIDESLELVARFSMPEHGDPSSAAVLFAMFFEHTMPPLLSTWLNEELAHWFSRQFVVSSEDSAAQRGVMLRAQLSPDALNLLLTLVEELLRE